MAKKLLSYTAILVAIFVLAMLLLYFISIDKTGSRILEAVKQPISKDTPPSTAPKETIITVYFPDKERFNVGTEPYEIAVQRKIPAGSDLKKAVLAELYKGPTASEKQKGLFMIYSGTTGAALDFNSSTKIAKIYLKGTCNGGGASYSLRAVLAKNFRQFSDIKYLRVYDENGETLSTKENEDSGPACLEP